MIHTSRRNSGTAHVNRDHTVSPATHTLNPQVGCATPTSIPQLPSFTALWPELTSHPTEGRRLSWSQQLTAHQNGIPTNGHLQKVTHLGTIKVNVE